MISNNNSIRDPQDTVEEEKYFSLILMKYVYRISNVPLPIVIEHKLKKLDAGISMFFTENMKDAMCTSISDMYGHNRINQNWSRITSDEYNADVHELQEFYTHEDFFEFLSSYAPQAVFERTDVIGDRFCDDIAGILKAKAPIRNSWIEFDRIAGEAALRNGILTKFRISNSETDMIKEQEFILRFINQVFLLHFKNLPEYLERQVNRLDPPHQTNPFTNNIAHAIAILLNNQIQVRYLLGEGFIERHYYVSVLKNFEPRSFLEFCVCLSRKALIDYSVNSRFDSPVKIYTTMVCVLKRAKECKEFISWDEIENAALQLIEDDVYRTENEIRRLKFINQYKEQPIVRDDLTKSSLTICNSFRRRRK